MSNSTAPHADWLTVQWFKQLFGHGDQADKPGSQDRARMTIAFDDDGVARIDSTQLKLVPLFAECDTPFLDQLALKFKAETYGAGASVISMNDPANKFYILAKGEAQVSKPGNGGVVHIAVLAAGAHTGEIGLLNGGTRTANVHARTECLFLALTAEDFIAVLKAQPKLHQHLEKIVKNRELGIKNAEFMRMLAC